MKAYYRRYVDYILKAGGSPTITWFDDDWSPIGPKVRKDLIGMKVIEEKAGRIYLINTEVVK